MVLENSDCTVFFSLQNRRERACACFGTTQNGLLKKDSIADENRNGLLEKKETVADKTCTSVVTCNANLFFVYCGVTSALLEKILW